MSADFIGLTVKIALKTGSGTFIGRVAHVQDRQLYLHNVNFLENGHHLAEYAIHGDEIMDLEIVPAPLDAVAPAIVVPFHGPPSYHAPVPAPAFARPLEHNHIQAPAPASKKALGFVPSSVVRSQTLPRPKQHVEAQPASKQTFVDPAILTFDRKPFNATATAQTPYPIPSDTTLPMPTVPETNPSQLIVSKTVPAVKSAPRTSSKTYDYLLVDDNTKEAEQEEVTVIPAESRRASKTDELLHANAQALPGKPSTKKRQRGRGKQSTAQQDEPALDDAPNSSPDLMRTAQPTTTGWRKTPILEEVQTMESPAKLLQVSSLAKVGNGTIKRKQSKKMGKRERERFEAQSGWGTEDATDVQDMGEFNFAANLANFDKKAVFQQLAADDDTAYEDRLVSFNRLPKPGTFGGTKLHPTENVLDGGNHGVGDEFGDSEDEFEDLATSQISLRSRTMSIRAPSRKGSRIVEGYASPPAANGFGRSGRSMSVIKSPVHVSFDSDSRVPSPVIHSMIPSHPTLRYSNSTKTCPGVQPETLVAVEAIAHSQFGLSPDLLDENAGRSIASVALLAINPGGARLASTNHNTRPVIVVLAGAHKSGARAIAAARHLAERGVRIIVTSPSPSASRSTALAGQAQRLGGTRDIIRTWEDTSAYLKTLSSPPELIIDALSDTRSSPFSPSSTDDLVTDISPDDTAITTAVAMMEWANKSAASVLAIDRPSGIDALNGCVEVWEGEPAEVRARIVVACGAPGVGLVRAMRLRQQSAAEVGAEGVGSGVEWKVFVVDIGLGGAGRVWAREQGATSGNARGKGESWVRFGGEWWIGVELAKAADGEGKGAALERRSSRRSLLAGDLYD